MKQLFFLSFILLLFSCKNEITKESSFNTEKYETHFLIINNKSPELFNGLDYRDISKMLDNDSDLKNNFKEKTYEEVVNYLVTNYKSWEKEQQAKEIENFIAQLEREVESAKSFDGDKFRNDVTSIQLEIAIFKVWKELYEKSTKNNESDIKKLGEELKKNAIQTQKKEFPKLRKNYSEVANKLLWENDIDVKISGGNKYTTLIFTGGVFASNKNIKDMQTELSEILTELRFKRTIYKWYKGQEDYTYYDLKTKKDEDF